MVSFKDTHQNSYFFGTPWFQGPWSPQTTLLQGHTSRLSPHIPSPLESSSWAFHPHLGQQLSRQSPRLRLSSVRVQRSRDRHLRRGYGPKIRRSMKSKLRPGQSPSPAARIDDFSQPAQQPGSVHRLQPRTGLEEGRGPIINTILR